MYNFDELIDRRHTNALSTDGFRSYIFHDKKGEMKWPWRDEDFIRMWVADMEFACPDCVLDGIRDRLDRRILGYTAITEPGYYYAFSYWCSNRYGWSFPQEQLRTAPGIVEALYELVGYLTKPDEKVLFFTPSYAYFKYAASYNSREAVCCDLLNNDGEYSVDFDAFERLAADEKTTVLILCNPHNPTGRVWTPEELTRIGEIAVKHGLWILSDEIHCDLLRVGLTHTPMGKVLPDYDRLVTCMAPSKTFNLAGLCHSNIIIRSEELRQIWDRRHVSVDNPLSIAAAESAYLEGGDWLEELRAYLDENFELCRTYFEKELPQAKFRVSQATYLAWVDLSACFTPDEDLPRFFADRAGVLLEGGNMFVQNSDGFIRLNLAMPRKLVEEGLKRICGAVKSKAGK